MKMEKKKYFYMYGVAKLLELLTQRLCGAGALCDIAKRSRKVCCLHDLKIDPARQRPHQPPS